MSKCPLCEKKTFKFFLTFCQGHPDVPLIVSTEHKSNFNQEEINTIKRIFPMAQFDMRSIPSHAHAVSRLKRVGRF